MLSFKKVCALSMLVASQIYAVPQGNDAASQMPVILSASNKNLLSLNGKTATGKIIVLNADTQQTPKFDIQSSKTTISIDPQSSCYKPVAAGAQCSFDLSFTGTGASEVRTPVTFQIGNNGTTSDSQLVNAIDMPRDIFYKASVDETDAQGFSGMCAKAFVTMNKNGVNVTYAGFSTSNGVAVPGAGGVFKTTDGVNWTPTGLSNQNINTLYAINDVLYAGTNNGIFKTVDGGANWISTNNGLPNRTRVFCLFSFNNVLYAGTGGAVYKTTDGVNWTYAGLADQMINSLYIFNNVLYAAASGIYKTTDGVTWTNIGPTYDTVHTLYSINNVLYAGTQSGGIYKTTDGATWTNIGLTYNTVHALYSINNVLYAGAIGGVFKTSDGATWTNMGPKNQCVYVLYSINGVLYAGTDNGTYQTVDGTNWMVANSELGNQNINTLCSIEDSLYAGTNGGVFKTTDHGANWINTGLSGVNSLNAINNVLYAGTTSGVFETTDEVNWTAVNNGLVNQNVNTLYSIHDVLYAGTMGGIFKTTDKVNWTAINTGLTNQNVYALYSTHDVLYAGTLGGGVFKTSDGGATWISTGLQNQNINVLYVMNNVLYAGTNGGGLYKATQAIDGSTDWTPINNGLTNQNVTALCAIDNVLYAGTSGTSGVRGIFKSTDAGATWVNIWMTTQDIKTLYSMNNILYAGVLAGGVYKAMPVPMPEQPSENWWADHWATVFGTFGTSVGLILSAARIYSYVKTNGCKWPWCRHNADGLEVPLQEVAV